MTETTTTLAGIRAEWAAQEADQAFANRIADSAIGERNWPLVARVVRRLADQKHRQYPQYRAYWAGAEWQLVRFTSTIRTKGGTRFERGDVTLARVLPSYFGCRPEVTAYSIRGAVNVAVSTADFEPFAG